MNIPKVYVIKEQVIRGDTGPIVVDYSAALKWGDLQFVTSHDLPMYGRSGMLESWNADVLAFIEAYDDQRDYIVTTGQPVAIFSIGWALGRANKVPRFLVWKREENQYKPMSFDASMPTGRFQPVR